MSSPHKKRRRNGSHSTMTPSALRVADVLRKIGLRPHAGPIGAGGGNISVSVIVEYSRIKIGVSGNGHQDILIYGEVCKEKLINALKANFQKNLIIRDPYDLWQLKQAELLESKTNLNTEQSFSYNKKP